MATLTTVITTLPASAASDTADMEIHSERATRKRSYFIRPFTLAGVIGSILFVLVFTIQGLLRPGYSPINQVVSDLGIGQDAWILTTDLVVFGLLSMLFAIGFYQAMRKSIGGKKMENNNTIFLRPGDRTGKDAFLFYLYSTEPASCRSDVTPHRCALHHRATTAQRPCVARLCLVHDAHQPRHIVAHHLSFRLSLLWSGVRRSQ